MIVQQQRRSFNFSWVTLLLFIQTVLPVAFATAGVLLWMLMDGVAPTVEIYSDGCPCGLLRTYEQGADGVYNVTILRAGQPDHHHRYWDAQTGGEERRLRWKLVKDDSQSNRR